MSFTAQIVSGRDIYLVQGTSPTGATWHYLQLDRAQKMAFLQALRTDQLDCATYGTILAAGRGGMPPSHVRWEIEQRDETR